MESLTTLLVMNWFTAVSETSLSCSFCRQFYDFTNSIGNNALSEARSQVVVVVVIVMVMVVVVMVMGVWSSHSHSKKAGTVLVVGTV